MLDLPEPCRIGDRGAGHPREDDARDNIHLSESSGNVADDRARETEDPRRDASNVHQVSREDEERNREQREPSRPEVHPVRQHREEIPLSEPREEDDGRQPDRDHDRDIDHQKEDENRKDRKGQHGGTSISRIGAR